MAGARATESARHLEARLTSPWRLTLHRPLLPGCVQYRLKSVAHLNWKFFMYKALNTFIDDLFAFIIKMPTLHRMSCFRDDIVFVVFMYQRYAYRVDMTRRNEFGHTGEGDAGDGGAVDLPAATAKKKGGKAAKDKTA
eukprot:CAMPEP_0115890158 /NCGR_PEP_ID=MMETSP0287-20121206/33204_1 /TAXON_ID=412157 /ORGANISM="Chrysochromulina rotalis, Strain UIO044" /LENGTH=137 /DNA_ID=CAMNT_0003346915 /DNA_START=195 /DNA_END=608 /DNA_ORIENTATION=+